MSHDFDKENTSKYIRLRAMADYVSFLCQISSDKNQILLKDIEQARKFLSRETYMARTSSLLVSPGFREDVHRTMIDMFLFEKSRLPLGFTTDKSARGKIARICNTEAEVRYGECVMNLCLAASALRHIPSTLTLNSSLFLDIDSFIAEVKNYLLSSGGKMTHFAHRLNNISCRLGDFLKGTGFGLELAAPRAVNIKSVEEAFHNINKHRLPSSCLENMDSLKALADGIEDEDVKACVLAALDGVEIKVAEVA